VGFPAERDRTRATIASAQVDLHLIDEIPGNHQVSLGSNAKRRGKAAEANVTACDAQEFSEPGPERPGAVGRRERE
jgi:hypothetical protein